MGTSGSRENKSILEAHQASEDFARYYKKIQKTLVTKPFSFSEPTDHITFEIKLERCLRISSDLAEIWIAAYIDYMILAAWTMRKGLEFPKYPPFAIQQVARLHSLYSDNFSEFCNIILGKGIVNLSPIRFIAQQNFEDYEICKGSYIWTKEYLFGKIYNNPTIHLAAKDRKDVEEIWESFEETYLKNEFTFLFIQPESIDNFSTKIKNLNDLVRLDRNTCCQDVLNIAKYVRNKLGLGDLMIFGQINFSNFLDSLIVDLKPFEQEVALEVHQITFKTDFVNLLAWENQISIQEALVWIHEYKKFLFLILVSEGNVLRTPSEIVDQVWHLHLQFVQNYYDDVCKTKAIYHFPSRGGEEETQKYMDIYGETLRAYNSYFGPHDTKIWPSTDQRFSEFGIYVSFSSLFIKEPV